MPNELVSGLHQKLARLFPGRLVLLGGSHLFNEATSDSDIDFSLLLPWWQFFYYKKIKVKILDVIKTVPQAACMLVPTLFGQPIGLYYKTGRDITGKIWLWGNRSIILRNAAKLALFNYIRSEALETDKTRSLQKAYKQLATAQILTRQSNLEGDLFSWAYILNNRAYAGSAVINLHTNCRSLTYRPELYPAVRHELVRELISWSELFWPTQKLSFKTYFLFNIFMLVRGKHLILRGDPDIIVSLKMLAGLKNGRSAKDIYKEVNEAVFPVLIVKYE